MAYKSLLGEVNKVYTISLNDRGEITKQWMYCGMKPNHGVFDLSKFQIIFPAKNLNVLEKWEYETTGVFTIFLNSKATYWIKRATDEKIFISFTSYLLSDDLMNNTKAEGEYILDRESCEVLYLRIESYIKAIGNSETIEIIKI